LRFDPDSERIITTSNLCANSPAELTKTCNSQAGNQKLTGDARKSFMSDCLSGKASTTLTPQQELMKSCNVQATTQKLKGDARKHFMSTCLKD